MSTIERDGKMFITSTKDIKEHINTFALEASLREGFEPDMLILNKLCYKQLFEIPAGVSLDVDKMRDIGVTVTGYDQQMLEAPSNIDTIGGTLTVVWSDRVAGMLLVESGSL